MLAPAIPAAGALLIGLTGRWPNARDSVTVVTAGFLLLVVGSLLPEVLAGGRPEVTLVEMMPGLSLRFELEPLGMIFAGLAALLWPINSLYSIGYMRGNGEANQTSFYVCFALALGSAMGIAFAGNLLTLFVFYELLTLTTYPLVTHSRSEEAMRAGRVYLGILLATSIGLLLLAIIWTWVVAGTVEFAPGGILAGRLTGPMVGVAPHVVRVRHREGCPHALPPMAPCGHGCAHPGERVAARRGRGEGGRIQRGQSHRVRLRP